MQQIRKVMTDFPAKKHDPTVQSLEKINERNLNYLFPLNDSNALQTMEEKLEDSVFQKDVVALRFCSIWLY